MKNNTRTGSRPSPPADGQMEIPHVSVSLAETERLLEERLMSEIKANEKPSPDDRLTIKQAEKLLDVSRRTVYNYSKNGLLRIDHDHKGKPYILRGQVDLVLQKKGDEVKKGQFIPEGHIVVAEDRYNAAHERLRFLEGQLPKLIEYQSQVEQDQKMIADLEAEHEKLKNELDNVKNRGFFARLFNKGVL